MPGGGTVLMQKVFDIRTARSAVVSGQFSSFEHICDLPDVPVLSETLLLMDLVVRNRVVDLTRVARVILSDPGAALQVMRLAGREFAADGPMGRIEDCISGIGLQACLDAMSKRNITRSSRNQAVIHAWDHARAIAEISGVIAEKMAPDGTREEAELVGLCHEIGSFAELLGWDWSGQSANNDVAGLSIAEAWALPCCVVEYFSDRCSAKQYSRWTTIVDRAHQIAGSSAAPMRASQIVFQ